MSFNTTLVYNKPPPNTHNAIKVFFQIFSMDKYSKYEYVKIALALFIPSAGIFFRSSGFKEIVLGKKSLINILTDFF